MEHTIDSSQALIENVSRETFLQLQEFKKFILKWNKTHNLTSRSSLSDEHLDKLILDCLTLDEVVPRGSRVLDIGSGGGFPGLVLAILGHSIDLVERNHKKTVFLNEAKRALHLDTCKVFNSDVTALAIESPYKFICSKAMASTKSIIDLSRKQAGPETKYLLLKSKSQLVEINEAKKFYHFDLQVSENKYKNDSVVLILSNVKDAKKL